MKAKRSLMIFALVSGLALLGFKNGVAQDVEVGIILPYSGNYNYWMITFTGHEGTYTFYTDDDTYDSGVLGTIPAGRYNIEFESAYYYEGFDFGVCGPNFYHFRSGHPTFDWFGAEIEDGTYIQMDAGY